MPVSLICIYEKNSKILQLKLKIFDDISSGGFRGAGHPPLVQHLKFTTNVSKTQDLMPNGYFFAISWVVPLSGVTLFSGSATVYIHWYSV
jgi:hypothetical protein